MAYWMAHLRTAELVLDKLDWQPDKGLYYAGTLAPDSGTRIPGENGKPATYVPPRRLSHWADDSPDWDAPIRYERFYEAYVKNETDFSKKSFRFGYYVHLFTDALWIELARRPLIEGLGSLESYRAAKPEIKADWAYTDRLFLQKHPDYKPLLCLYKLENFCNTDLDYFPEGLVESRIRSLRQAYGDVPELRERSCPYFSYELYERTVITVSNIIVMHLRSH